MKKLVLMAVLAFSLNASAQVITPQPSPKAEIEQTVGLTQVEVEYARPAKRGRLIYGDLVPYGKMWRTGANENTKVSFGDDVIIDGKKLVKGTYALYTLPKADSWDVFFYTDTNNWGLPTQWDDKKVALKTTVTPDKTDLNVEYFTIFVNPVDPNSGELTLRWEDTSVTVKFEVPTHEKAMASIKTSLTENASARDYYSAAQYIYASDENIQDALSYINKSIALQKNDVPYYILRQKALILAKAGDKKAAIETAKQSLEAAQKANNEEYVKMNAASIKEWSK